VNKVAWARADGEKLPLQVVRTPPSVDGIRRNRTPIALRCTSGEIDSPEVR